MQRDGVCATLPPLSRLRPRTVPLDPSAGCGLDQQGTFAAGSTNRERFELREEGKMHRRSLALMLALSIFGVLALPAGASATPVEGPAGQAFCTPPTGTPAGSAGEL